MKYQMLGIDLDGTLLGPDGQLSAANRAALRRAVAAGLVVVPCTGRGWRESAFLAEQLGDVAEVGVFVTGATVRRIDDGAVLHEAFFEPRLAASLVAMLDDLPDAVLLYRSCDLAGHEYLVTGEGELTDNTRWWFEQTGVSVATQPRIEAESIEHTLRVGMVAAQPVVERALRRLDNGVGDRLVPHAFPALRSPDGEEVWILEVFPPGVNKFTGLLWLARHLGLDPDRIAAIGDQVNDTPMLEGAACGIAMANAAPEARAAADHVTLSNAEDGVAHAIDRILEGRW